MTPLKYWRLTYKTIQSPRLVVVSLTFLTVKEVFEHTRLMGIDKFKLEDFTNHSRFTH